MRFIALVLVKRFIALVIAVRFISSASYCCALHQ